MVPELLGLGVGLEVTLVAVARGSQRQLDELPALLERLGLVAHLGFDVDDLLLDSLLARAERVAVDVAAQVQIEQAVAIVRKPFQAACDEPGGLCAVVLVVDDVSFEQPLQARFEGFGDLEPAEGVLDLLFERRGRRPWLTALAPSVVAARADVVGELLAVATGHDRIEQLTFAGTAAQDPL